MTTLRQETPGAAAQNPNAAVTGVDRRTLDTIFRHPLAHNLAWREVVSLFDAIGDAEEKHNGDFLLYAGGEELSMRRPHDKDLTGSDVMDLRHFLTRTGWAPDAPTSSQPAAALHSTGLIVVIDHAGARVYRIDRSLGAGQEVHPPEARHFHHELDRKAHDKDREETYPADERFFEAIAVALAPPGEIVLIGHGKGQSNEAEHLSAFLQKRHRDIHGRIVRTLAADLPRLTPSELVELGRTAFGPK